MNKTQAKQKVNEWRELVLKQYEQLQELGLGQVKEITSPKGGEMIVSIGWVKGYSYADINFTPAGGQTYVINIETPIKGRCQDFINFYQANYEYFDELLETITQKTNVIVNATNSLFEAILEKDIPTLMMDRMMGEQLSDKPGELLQHLAKKEAEELVKILPVPNGTLRTFSCYLSNYDISLTYRSSSWSVVMKGMDISSPYFTPNTTKAIRIVSAFPKTKEFFEKFARYVIEMDKSLELLGKEE